MFEQVNWIGALVSSIVVFLVGAVWYSPLMFAKPWQRALGLSDEDMKSGNIGRIFLSAFIAILVAAVGFSMVIGEGAGWRGGLHWGLIVGLLFVATSLAIHNAFERRPFHYWTINAGYNLLQFVIYGLILGAWPN